MKICNRLNEASTSELISIFQNVEDTSRNSELAFVVLCTRFRRDLIQKCEIVCKNYGHSVSVAEEIAEETFRRYAKHPNYDPKKSNVKNDDIGFMVYLYAIAKRALIDYYRNRKRAINGCDYDGSECIVTELPQVREGKLDLKSLVQYAAIESLSKRHKAVYLTYKVYERKGFNLPKKLQQELRDYVGTDNQSTIRSIKKEAVDRINAYLAAMEITKDELDEGKSNE